MNTRAYERLFPGLSLLATAGLIALGGCAGVKPVQSNSGSGGSSSSKGGSSGGGSNGSGGASADDEESSAA